MALKDRESLEKELGERAQAGAHADVAERLVRGYGPEILGFLTATLRDQASAEDVFSIFCEQMVRNLPAFERKCSFRTWSYTVARNAAHQYRLARKRRGNREVAGDSRLSAAAEEVRSQTAQYLRTEMKSRFAALRDALPEDDRVLLVLRVDKGLGFDEIARVMLSSGGDDPDPSSLKREAARLRKRFQLVKERLLEMGRSEGLIGDD